MQLTSKKTILVVITSLFMSTVFAQNKNVSPSLFSGVEDYRTWSLEIWGAPSSSVSPLGGDNTFNQFDFKNLGLLYGATIKKQIFHQFGLEADFMRGTVKGGRRSNQGPIIYNLPADGIFAIQNFKTTINWASSLSGVVSLGAVNWINHQSTFFPYLSLGGGVMSFNPRLSDASGNKYYSDNSTGLSTDKPNAERAFYIPVGVGAKINLSTGVNLDLGYHLNFVNSKSFDGISYMGNNDKFSSFRVGIEFALGNKSKPQLSVVNPAAMMGAIMQDQNESLKQQIKEANEKSNASMTAMQEQIDALKKDTDGDGVTDVNDKCPGTPQGVRVDGAGCPLPQPKQIIKQEKVVVTQEDRKIVDEAIKNLEFDLGKATIRPTSFASLNDVAELLVNKNFSLKLGGHTDNTGNDVLNMRLSKQRAEAVKQYLVEKGANASRIEAVGYGSTQPIDTNDTPEGRQKNRRVEFTLY